MRNTVVGRILFYLTIYAVLFLILCVISVVKNWRIVMASVGGTLTSVIGSLVMIGLVVYAIGMILSPLFR